MKKGIVIIGAGGHGKVIADAVIKANQYDLLGFVDAHLPIGTKVFGAYEIIESQENIDTLINDSTKFIIGIGNNDIRKKIQEQLAPSLSWVTVVHPSAVISYNVVIGEGSVVLANAVINADSKIGEFTIVDSGVIVDHDCEIGSFSHLTIGTLVGSNSKLPTGTKTSLGQVFNPFTTI
jgi:sugar O-acyltransferase (sialic acid O-acetyltransferase NeuD family)